MTYTVDESYRLKKLSKLVASKKSVLDIGCAQYPNPFLKNNYVVGVDICHAELPENYSAFYQKGIEPLVGEGLEFEAVVAGEVLEHVEEPLCFLRHCRQLLAPGGIIALSTPNPHSPIEFLLTWTLNKKYYYADDHIMLFPQRWLIRILVRAGFKDVKLYSGGFPIPGLGQVICPRIFCHQTIAAAIRA